VSILALSRVDESQRRALGIGGGATGLLATGALTFTEPSHTAAIALLVVAVGGLVLFDWFIDGPLAAATPIVPFLQLFALAEALFLHGGGMRPDIGVAVQGVIIGALTALLAVGLALVFRANRVINFSQGDLGVVPAVLAIVMFAPDAEGGAPDWLTGLPYFFVLFVGLAAALIVGFLVERLIIARFSRAPRLVLTVATIGVAQLLGGLGFLIPQWFYAETTFRVPEMTPPFDWSWSVGGTILHENDLIVFIAAPLLLAALTLFMRYTRVGIAVRATAERTDRAASLGVPTGRIQTTVWVIAAVLAYFTIFLRAGVTALPLGASALSITILIRALAALVIGRMDDFPRIAAAAVGLGVVEQAVVFDTGRDLYVYPVMFLVVVVAMTLSYRQQGSRVDDQAVSSWEAARENRPMPRELAPLPEVRLARAGIFGAIAIFFLTLPMWVSNAKLSLFVDAGSLAIVAVSLVLLTGWAGHVSLGQVAFAGVGAAASGWATQTAGLDLGLALLVGGLAGAAISVIVGIPAARAGGLTLAVTTLTFAVATLFILLNPEFMTWIPRGRFAEPITLFGSVDLESQASFYYLMLGVLAFACAMALGIRRSRTGRVLIALRENPRAAQAYGVNTTRTLLASFAFAGFIAAMGGVVSVHHSHGFRGDLFNNVFGPEQSIIIFAVVVIGGLASIPGSILGVAYITVCRYFLPQEWTFLATGIGLLFILFLLPGGLGAGLAEVRDAFLRWRGRARNIVVPSLIADRRVELVEVTPAMAAAVAEAIERPEVEEIAELHA
jgi:branched-chain amino acid transport system permease protein